MPWVFDAFRWHPIPTLDHSSLPALFPWPLKLPEKMRRFVDGLFWPCCGCIARMLIAPHSHPWSICSASVQQLSSKRSVDAFCSTISLWLVMKLVIRLAQGLSWYCIEMLGVAWDWLGFAMDLLRFDRDLLWLDIDMHLRVCARWRSSWGFLWGDSSDGWRW